jgi:hypothetical protein
MCERASCVRERYMFGFVLGAFSRRRTSSPPCRGSRTASAGKHLASILQHNIAVLLDIDIAGRMITACEYSE